MTGPSPAESVRLEAPQGTFHLERHPPSGRRPLRAWDAADELLLDEVAATAPTTGRRTLVIDDAFGALTVALAAASLGPVHVLTDSHVARLAIGANLARNPAPDAAPILHHGPGTPAELEGAVDLVVFKVPKSLAAFEERLRTVRAVARPGALVMGASMTRHLHRSHLDAAARIVGPARTSLARRKARTVHVSLDPTIDPDPSPWPRSYELSGGGTVVGHAGVHAAGRLDPGTAFLLDHLPRDDVGSPILDLGCGDGALALRLAQLHPSTELVLVDESDAAVASARATVARNGVEDRAAVLLGDVLESAPGVPLLPAGSVGTVVVNPPFHADHAIVDDTAWRMFSQAREVLRPGGQLWVVGNRHLAHHAKLKRLYGNCEVVASNPKFVVCRAERGPGRPGGRR